MESSELVPDGFTIIQNVTDKRTSISYVDSYKSRMTLIENKPSGYHILSVDVLRNIFQYFDEKILLKNIMPVCRHWRHVAASPELWKKLYINGNDVPTSFICQKIRDYKYLEYVYLNGIAEPVTVIRQICRWIPHIKHLRLKDCPEIAETSLHNLIQCCKYLEGLDLNGTQFKVKRFCEEIAGLKFLKSINLSRNVSVNICNILTIALNCRQLEELIISSFCPSNNERLTDEDASFIITNLAPTLKSLTLDAGNLSDFSFKAITKCSKLEKLGLYRAINLSPHIFTNLWKSMPNLKVLKIRHSPRITGLSVSDLFTAGKPVMKQIVHIDFTGCWKITDNGMEAVADCCNHLISLILKGCKSIQSLKSIQNKCKKLEKLNIAFCDNLDFDTIVPLPKHLHTLILDNSNKYSKLLEIVLHDMKIPDVKICLSEYNKEMQEM